MHGLKSDYRCHNTKTFNNPVFIGIREVLNTIKEGREDFELKSLFSELAGINFKAGLSNSIKPSCGPRSKVKKIKRWSPGHIIGILGPFAVY